MYQVPEEIEVDEEDEDGNVETVKELDDVWYLEWDCPSPYIPHGARPLDEEELSARAGM